MAAALGERGWTVISGGAYGIDGCAHRGALAADGVTIAVLDTGVDRIYPPGHRDLLTGVTAQGVLVSEWPPGRTPTRRRFLIRNRVIGALSQGTVVVEAGLRSGALNARRHARDLGRPLMAVPGPVTSDVSAGCHKIIREWGAVPVTGAADVIEMLSPFGESGSRPLGETGPNPPVPGERAAPVQEVLWPAAAGPQRSAGPRHAGHPDPKCPSRPYRPVVAGRPPIAVAAGLRVDAVVRSLGLLAAGGYVERCSRGWRIRPPTPG